MDRLLRLTIAYDGTHYAGWQSQREARTVQQTFEKALREFAGRPVRVTGAGRTDSGVHAQGQVAHVLLPDRHTTATVRRALNALLPDDVLVLSVRAAPPGFHARYSAREKWYRYSIWNCSLRPLRDRARLVHVPSPLDLAGMRSACRILEGRHDFRAFYSSGRRISSTVRTLRRLRVKREGKLLLIDAEADGFLYHMVRRIAGLLIDVGKGKQPPSVARELLHGSGTFVAPTAPARGLCLMKVCYSR